MTLVSEMARVTTRPGRAEFSGEAKTVPEQAWLLWTRFRGVALDDPTAIMHDGGITVIGSAKTHARFLFPELPWGDEDAERAFMMPIYKYLRDSGNAKVLRKNIAGSPYMSEWWLSGEWITLDEGGGKRKTPQSSWQEKRTKAEAKLTAHEAGEDREPAPVTVTKRAAKAQAKYEAKVLNSKGRPMPPLPTETVHIGKDGRRVTESLITEAQRTAAIAREVGHALVPTFCNEPACAGRPPFKSKAAIGGHVAMHNKQKRQALANEAAKAKRAAASAARAARRARAKEAEAYAGAENEPLAPPAEAALAAVLAFPAVRDTREAAMERHPAGRDKADYASTNDAISVLAEALVARIRAEDADRLTNAEARAEVAEAKLAALRAALA